MYPFQLCFIWSRSQHLPALGPHTACFCGRHFPGVQSRSPVLAGGHTSPMANSEDIPCLAILRNILQILKEYAQSEFTGICFKMRFYLITPHHTGFSCVVTMFIFFFTCLLVSPISVDCFFVSFLLCGFPGCLFIQIVHICTFILVRKIRWLCYQKVKMLSLVSFSLPFWTGVLMKETSNSVFNIQILFPLAFS